jgi:hypothetical protein
MAASDEDSEEDEGEPEEENDRENEDFRAVEALDPIVTEEGPSATRQHGPFLLVKSESRPGVRPPAKDLFDHFQFHGSVPTSGCNDAAFTELVPGIDKEHLLPRAVRAGHSQILTDVQRTSNFFQGCPPLVASRHGKRRAKILPRPRIPARRQIRDIRFGRLVCVPRPSLFGQ